MSYEYHDIKDELEKDDGVTHGGPFAIISILIGIAAGVAILLGGC